MKKFHAFLLTLFFVAPLLAQQQQVPQATDSQVESGADVKRYVNPRQYQFYMGTNGGGGGSGSNSYQLQKTGLLLNLVTNTGTHVYTISAVDQTNALGLGSGLAANVSTNRFDINGAGQSAADATSNLLSLEFNLGASGFVSLITNGSPTAVIQATLDGMTNSGVVSIQPGTYTITDTLSLTNTMVIQGNGATFLFAIGKTNVMLDTGTNYAKPLVIQNLRFDGGQYSNYNTATYLQLAARGGSLDANPYYNSWNSNRIGLRVEISGGVVVENCYFVGWCGTGVIFTSQRQGSDYFYPKLLFTKNHCFTNFQSVLLACTAEDTLGYYNNDAASQGAWSCEYALVSENDFTTSYIGLSATPGNVKVLNNFMTEDYFCMLQNSGDSNPTHGVYSGNHFTHGNYGIWSWFNMGGLYSGNFFGRCGQDIQGPNNTNIYYPNGSASGIHFDGCVGVTFIDNQISREWLTFTNGTFGVLGNNSYGGFNNGRFAGAILNDSNLVWGVDVPTNIDSGMTVFGNHERLGMLNDGSMGSILSHATNNPVAGSVAYTPDGTNSIWQPLPPATSYGHVTNTADYGQVPVATGAVDTYGSQTFKAQFLPFQYLAFNVTSNAFTNVICGYLSFTNADGRTFTIGVGTNQ